KNALRRLFKNLPEFLLRFLNGLLCSLAFGDVLKESLKANHFSARPADFARRHDAPKKRSVFASELTRTAASFSLLFQDSDKGGSLCRIEPYLAAPVLKDGNCLPRRAEPEQPCPSRVDGNRLALYRVAKDGLRRVLEELAIFLHHLTQCPFG